MMHYMYYGCGFHLCSNVHVVDVIRTRYYIIAVHRNVKYYCQLAFMDKVTILYSQNSTIFGLYP